APQRDFHFRVNTLVAGIRGTDVWGKADDTKDVVILIEGRVTVARGPDEIALDKPRSVYAAPRDGTAPAVSRVTARQLAALAAETEILAGAGGAWSGGRYRVVVITTVDETYARDLHERLRAGGYPAELRAVEHEGSPVYQVYLADLGGEREARAVAQRLRAQGYTAARPAR
ncbi:MAG TPA: SPOR domain-containing protein, partial [Burkholderiales bacterium]|nr:SPOR domain-containing protein [Burkholderiales bacterium]